MPVKEALMLRSVTCGLVVLTLGALPPIVRAGEDKGKTEPRDAPLELKIVAKKTTYTLDLGGKTADDFKKTLQMAQTSGAYPPAPAVDLVLELKNTSDRDIEVWVSGDPTRVMLDLKGPGAMNVELKGLAFTLEFRVPKAMRLAAGQVYKIDIKSLTYGQRGATNRSYWVLPGEYTLTASFKTAVAPAPKGAKQAEGNFGEVTVTSAPIKLKVEAK
jgi:hypothetical protein